LKLYSFESTLSPLPPFDFSQSLAFISNFGPMMNEQEVSENSFTKTVEIEGKTIVFEVTGIGNIENPKLHLTVSSENKLTEKIEKLVTDRISFFLSLKDDLKEFYKIANQDESFKPAVKRFYGHKQVKFLTPFEIACWAILAQRIPMAISHKMKERIVQKLGGHIQVKGIEFCAFPEAQKLAEVPLDNLLEMVPNRRKAEYLHGVAKAFSQVDEQWLTSGNYDEVYQWLTDIKGIGDWSAHFVMIRGLGRMEKLTNIEPQFALDVAKIYLRKSEPATDIEVCNLGEKYGKWIGYWAYYLRIYSEFAYVLEEVKKHQHE